MVESASSESAERRGTVWIRPLGSRINLPELRPPGQSQGDSWLTELPSRLLFDPDKHLGPKSLNELGDLFVPVLDLSELPDLVGELPIEAESIDVLAWYQTFRREGDWGIYIRETGLRKVAVALVEPGSVVSRDAWRAAALLLYLHEYAHFLLDDAALTMEGIVGSPLYALHRTETLATSPGWHPPTEALCNAFAYRTLRAPGFKARVRRFLRRGPIGYRDFGGKVTDSEFDIGVEGVLGTILRGHDGNHVLGGRSLFCDRPNHRVGPWVVPIHLVAEPEGELLSLVTAIPSLEESDAFARQLRKQPVAVQVAWKTKIEPALSTDVRSIGSFKRLKGDANEYSMKVLGQYRVIIAARGDGTWNAKRIGHRSKVYR